MKKKIIAIITSFLFLAVIITGNAIAETYYGEPAPNHGDGISDGSGFDMPNGPSQGPGPAPNSGDGIPDGPGWS